MTGGSLLKVVDLTDILAGSAITGLNLSRSALVGDPLAFQVTFANGSQALFTWSQPVLAGDFNTDGKVDAADYVAWRKAFGSTYTQDDYTAWRNHFSQTTSGGMGATADSFRNASSNVPEPSSPALLIVLLVAAKLIRPFWRPSAT
jgi:hypothetical protein